MRRSVAIVLLPLLLSLASCDAVRISGALNTTSSMTGTVSNVQLLVVDNGVQVTVVTFFVQTNSTQDLTLCGNFVPQLPPNSNVTVRFVPGPICASNVAITIIF